MLFDDEDQLGFAEGDAITRGDLTPFAEDIAV